MQKYHQVKWQAYDALLSKVPQALHGWLLDPNSFMDRLRSHGAQSPYVTVLHQSWQLPLQDEGLQLGMHPHAEALIREVLILSEGKQWMYARTVFPRTTLTGEQQCLASLESRSLGSVLFNDSSMQRSEFEVSCIKPSDDLHNYISEQTKTILPELWARRSRFTLQNKPLLLTEVFLPDIQQL